MVHRIYPGVGLAFVLAACSDPVNTPNPSNPSGGTGGQAGSAGNTGGSGGSSLLPTGGAAGSGMGGTSGGSMGGSNSSGSAGTGGASGGAGGSSAGMGGAAGGGGGAGGGSGGGGAGGTGPCPEGHAIQFDGDSRTQMNATIGNTLPLGNASRTVEMWVYSVAKTWRAEHHLYQYGGTNPREGAFGIDFGDGPYPNTQVYTNGTADTTFKVPQDTVKETGWFHYAMVWDESAKTLKGVINGVTAVTKNVNVMLTTSVSPLSIGYSPTFSGNGGFTGKIDEFRVWNVARTDAQILSTMHQHLTGKEPGLVVYFPFDEGTGMSSKDLVNNYQANFEGNTKPTWTTSEVELSCK